MMNPFRGGKESMFNLIDEIRDTTLKEFNE